MSQTFETSYHEGLDELVLCVLFLRVRVRVCACVVDVCITTWRQISTLSKRMLQLVGRVHARLRRGVSPCVPCVCSSALEAWTVNV